MAWVLFNQSRGWRQGVLTGSILASAVLLLNIILTIVSSVSTSGIPELSSDRKLLFQGDCDRARRLNEGLHWVINVISTILLSASNYGMQCLSAPTRKEVDRSHAKRQWLDIGVMSFRNISRISRKRAILWFVLGFSSLPLHLFYNSAVYSSIYAVDYIVYQVTEDMLVTNGTRSALPPSWVEMIDPTSGISIDKTLLSSEDYLNFPNYTLAARKMYASVVANNLTRLTPSDCIAAYSSGTYQTSWGSVILVTSNRTNASYTYPYQNEERASASWCFDPFGWVCGRNNRVIPGYEYNAGICKSPSPCSSILSTSDFRNNQLDNWRPFGNKVDYCLAEPVPQRCTVEFSPQLAAVVIVFNAIKVVTLLYVFLRIKERPLITTGDAVASFLEREDETTQKLCLMSKAEVDETWRKGEKQPRLRPFQATRQRWYKAVSGRRWIVCISLYLTFLSILIGLFNYGLTQQQNATASSLMALGFDTTDPHSFITGWRVEGLLSSVFVANSPQPILSSIYYIYNGLFTLFLLGLEWNSYQSQRKGLRVSDRPRGLQRSSYILQLPKRWALPLMALSATLHWLCSQSIFLVSILFDSSVFAVENRGSIQCSAGSGFTRESCITELFTCGYSPAAILTTILLGLLMMVGLICVGARKYKNAGMPVASSCSAAISAACHLSPRIAGEENDQIASPLPSPDSRSIEMKEPLLPLKPVGSGKSNTFSSCITSFLPLSNTPSSHQGASIEEDLGAAYDAVQWGALRDFSVTATHDQQLTTTGEGEDSFGLSSPSLTVGHCTFTNKEVVTPLEGRTYAG